MDDKIRVKLKSPSESTSLLHRHEEPYWKQYLAAFIASLASLSTGCVGGWSSPATPALLGQRDNDLGIEVLTVEEASWVGSLINLGAFCGSIPAGYLSFKWGRKICLLTLSTPIIIGWLLILFNDNNVWFLYIGRFISGISYGSLNVALPIYNNEICNYRIRGRIGIMTDLLQTIGLCLVFVWGAALSLFWLSACSLLLPIIFVLTFVWMPESPLHLFRSGQVDKAIESIKWFHGENCDIEAELLHIRHALDEGKCDRNIQSESCRSSKRKGFVLSKVTIKAVLLMFFTFVLQRSCGATMIQYYGDSIFDLSHSSILPSMATVWIGIVSVIGSIMSVLAVDSLGRRFLLIFTFLVMTLSMFVFVAYLIFIVNGSYMIDNVDDALREYYGLIPTISLCVFVAMFRLGVSPVPWFMAPEIIPTEAQKWAPSTIVCITWGTSFLLSKSFLPAIDAFGQVAVYTCFSIVCFIGTIYTWILIPETKNKSREQIQRELGATT